MVNTIAERNKEKVRSTIIMQGWEYLDYLNPCVYGWKRQDEWLYIGSSSQGVKRLFSHDIVGHIDEIQKTDEFHIWQFPGVSMFKVLTIERELIAQLKPKYNKAHNGGVKRSSRASYKVPEKQELLALLNLKPKEKMAPIKTPKDFPIKLKSVFTPFDHLIRIKDLPDDFPISKGTLYNWSAEKKYVNLFVTVEKTLFIDIEVFETLLKRGLIKKGAYAI